MEKMVFCIGVAFAAVMGGAGVNCACADNMAAGMKTPATSKLFVKFVDPVSGVVSYILKPGSVAFNQQTTYFTAKSMTDDGRFLVFSACDDEFPPERHGRRVSVTKRKVLVDFLRDETVELGACGGTPFIDTKTDQMWYTDRDGVHRRDLLVDPKKDVLLCTWPPELAPERTGGRYGTHITFSPDRRLMFMDTSIDGQDVEGVMDVTTGKWTEWARSNFLCNHGQFNPKDPTLAMCAWERARFKVRDEMTPEEIARATFKGRFVSDIERSEDDVYPRLWLMREGKAWEVTSKITGYATHEYFAEDGKGFYWCSRGVSYHDLATGREWRINPISSAHATMTADNRYIVSDYSWGGWWRGCGWTVQFWNRDTHRAVYIHSRRPRIASKENESAIHPDPHPHFACADRYVVSTFNDEERRLNVSVTPVDQLVAITSDPATAPKPKTFPLAFDPASRTDATYEMEIDVRSLRERKYVAEPACTAVGDSYTPFALRAVVDGKDGLLPFEAVQGSDYTNNVVLRFKLPKGTQKLFCVADAPGRFEYYDSESCANIFSGAYDHASIGRWKCSSGVRASTHRAGLVFEHAGDDESPVVASVAELPGEAAGRGFKFELDLRNLGRTEWCGGVRLVQLDSLGRELGDALKGAGLKQTVASDRRGIYRLAGTFESTTRKVRLDIGLKAMGGQPAKVLVCRLNLREATVFPYTPPEALPVRTAVPDTPDGGRTLYNGIVLPKEWPPKIDPKDPNPIPAPYLQAANIPRVIPIDLGRQLFVDDFLIESTNGVVRAFGKPVKYEGNPVMWRQTQAEMTAVAPGCAMSGGGVWWDPTRRKFRMWYMSGFKLRTAALFSFWVAKKPTGESGGYVAAGGPDYNGLRDL